MQDSRIYFVPCQTHLRHNPVAVDDAWPQRHAAAGEEPLQRRLRVRLAAHVAAQERVCAGPHETRVWAQRSRSGCSASAAAAVRHLRRRHSAVTPKQQQYSL
jgi:hypothetical protein